jgi:hypothetical protein
VAYFEEELSIGNIPLPRYITPSEYVNDAADEIDSMIGAIYKTPIDISTNGPVSRPSRLLLKRLNKHLAMGRLILAVTSAEEHERLHAYGQSLVAECLAALMMLQDGRVKLDGAAGPDGNDLDDRKPAVVLINKDPESNVEAFYDRLANPNYSFAPTDLLRRAGG